MNQMGSIFSVEGLFGICLFAAAAALTYTLLCLLRPLLQRYAQVLPNARSAHKKPTPQGGGIGVISALIVTVAGISLILGGFAEGPLPIVLAAVAFIAMVGAADDIKPIPVLPRLLLQATAVVAVLAALPHELRVVAALPFWIERGILLFAMLWFVNLVNFMDGLDWMTVAETVPVSAGLVVLGTIGALSSSDTVAALALCGAIAGFAPFNRPVAKLFLGDVGSLAIGLLLASLLIDVAGRGHLTAALLLPLYYIADATITLIRRLIRKEPVWQAHRNHFYQRAADRGMTTIAIVGRVFAVNVVLAGFAIASVYRDDVASQILAMICGTALVGWLLYTFEIGARVSQPSQ